MAILIVISIKLLAQQSVSVTNSGEWEYRFYVDLTFESYARYLKAIDAVRPLMSDFKSLGEYSATSD